MPLGNSFTILKSRKGGEVKVEIFLDFVNFVNERPRDILFYNNELYATFASNSIKKIDLNKNITNFADLKLSGYDLNCFRISVDNSGNIYSIDSVSTVAPGLAPYRFKVIKVDRSGNVTELFFAGPNGLSVAVYNNFLFFNNNEVAFFPDGEGIRKYDLINNTTHPGFVGNQKAVRATNMKFDSKGNLYTSNITGATSILKFTKNDGANPAFLGYNSPGLFLDYTTLLGGSTIPNSGVQGMCFDKNDNLYFNVVNAIYKRSFSDGKISFIAGNIFSVNEDKIGSAKEARFNAITSMCWVDEGPNGVLYVCDYINRKIKKVFL